MSLPMPRWGDLRADGRRGLVWEDLRKDGTAEPKEYHSYWFCECGAQGGGQDARHVRSLADDHRQTCGGELLLGKFGWTWRSPRDVTHTRKPWEQAVVTA